MGRNLAWLGVVLFAVSWFLPVHEGLEGARAGRELAAGVQDLARVLGEPADARRELPGYGGPPGWQACRMAYDLLREEAPHAREALREGGEGRTKRIVLGASSLANVAMLLAVLVLLLSVRSLPAVLGLLLLACSGLALSWTYLTDAAFREGLRLGYWAWAGSFAVVGLGMLAGRSAPAPAAPPAA